MKDISKLDNKTNLLKIRLNLYLVISERSNMEKKQILLSDVDYGIVFHLQSRDLLPLRNSGLKLSAGNHKVLKIYVQHAGYLPYKIYFLLF